MSKKIRVAINGAGRIGRAFYKLARQRPEIEIVAINDLGDINNIAYLLKFDTVYGRSGFNIEVKGSDLVVAGKKIRFISEKDPSKLPWRELDIDVVVEATGFFASYAGSKAHLEAGAKKVIVTAPMKDEPVENIKGATVLMGVNEDRLSTCQITSNASCTTNAASPLIAILDEEIGIEKAILNTAHANTINQPIVDAPSKHNVREGRAGGQNIVPMTTGAAISVTEAFTKLKGRFDGIAMRVPVICGSLVDVTFIAKRDTSVEEINEVLKKAAKSGRWKGIFAVTDEELVSSDIIGSTCASLADLKLTRVVGGNLVKVLAWYDNEVGYCYSLLDHVIKFGSYLK